MRRQRAIDNFRFAAEHFVRAPSFVAFVTLFDVAREYLSMSQE